MKTLPLVLSFPPFHCVFVELVALHGLTCHGLGMCVSMFKGNRQGLLPVWKLSLQFPTLCGPTYNVRFSKFSSTLYFVYLVTCNAFSWQHKHYSAATLTSANQALVHARLPPHHTKPKLTVTAFSTAQSPTVSWQVWQLTCATAALLYYHDETDGCMKRVSLCVAQRILASDNYSMPRSRWRDCSQSPDLTYSKCMQSVTWMWCVCRQCTFTQTWVQISHMFSLTLSPE